MKKILVVDDEPIIANGISTMIQQFAIEAEIAATVYAGQDALLICQQQPIDIVVTDINMPILNGLELIRAIHLINPKTQIIVLTGFGTFEYAKESMELGVRYFIQKPCQPEELKRSLVDSLHLVEEHQQVQRLHFQRQIEQQILTRETVLTTDFPTCTLIMFDSKYSHMLVPWFAKTLDSKCYISGNLKKAVYYVSLEDTSDITHFTSKLAEATLPHCVIFYAKSVTQLTLYDTFRIGLKAFEKEFYFDETTLLHLNQMHLANNLQKDNQLYQHLQTELFDLLENSRFSKAEACVDSFFKHCASMLYPVKLLQIECNHLVTNLIDRFKIPKDKLASELSIKLVLSSSANELSYLVLNILSLIREANCSTEGNIIASLNRIIEEHYDNEELSLRWISKNLLFLNPEYLGKAYFKQTHNKFNQQLVAIRITKAKELLNNDYRVYEVAKAVGFGDNSEYFSQVFKKHVGITPHRFAKTT